MKEKIRKAVELIVEDLSDRKGLRQAYENIDADIQEEIKETWTAIIEKEIS